LGKRRLRFVGAAQAKAHAAGITIAAALRCPCWILRPG